VPPRSTDGISSAPASEASATPLAARSELTSWVILVLLTQCAIMALQPIVSLHVRELIGERPDLATLAGLAFSVVGLSGLLAAPLVGRASDAKGARSILLVIVPAAALLTVPQAYAPSYGWFVTQRFFAGLFLAGIIPVVNAMIGRNLTESERGRAFGLTSGATFFGAALGPVSGGLIGAKWGLSSVFLYSGAILSILALWIARKPARRR